MSESRYIDLGAHAKSEAFREIVDVFMAVNDALWDHSDGREALAAAERLRLDGNVPADLMIRLLTSWGQLATRSGRLADSEMLLRRAQSLLPKDAAPELEVQLWTLEGVVAAWRGDMIHREQTYGRALRALSPDSSEGVRHRISRAHFLATMGRESEVDAELGALECREARSAEQVLLVRFIQAVDTCRFDDALNLSGAVRRFGWDISGHRAFFLALLDLAVLRWRLAGAQTATEAGGGDELALPSWAEVMDHLLAGRPAEALLAAKREAGDSLEQCVTKTGVDSFNLIRAELANGNWQAAVRLVGLRRGRGNVHYLDDYFLAVACLLAGQRSDAAAHFVRVHKACAAHDALGRLEFELHMACALRPGDAFWLSRAAAEARGAASSAIPAAIQKRPPAEARGLARLVGPSEAMTAVRDGILRVAQLDAPVLVTGETGVGKELVARAIHECGPRADSPFLAVNCGAIAESLLESELFGHERGAFTGAAGAHRGLFETAGEGTILLDEIGEIPQRLQVGLLRVLESGEIRPVGGSTVRRVRCRILAATNAELEEMVAHGAFRKDLYYRLARLSIHVAPLRERCSDIGPLALHFLAESRVDGETPRLSARLAESLRSARWPGNVRELRNAVERMRLLGSEKLLYDLEDLDVSGAGKGPEAPSKAMPAAARDSVLPTAEPPGGHARVADDVEGFLRAGRTALRRLERLRELFVQHGKLTRAEIAAILDVAPKTATADLKELCRAGLIEKVEPSASRRTHYFRIR